MLAIILDKPVEGNIYEDDFNEVSRAINDFFRRKKKFDEKYKRLFDKLNDESEIADGELERLSELRVSYYEPASVDIDPLLFKLSEGDISKTNVINDLDVDYCYDWYYLIKVRELNELKLRIAEWKTIKKD